MHGSVMQFRMDQPPGTDTGAVWQVRQEEDADEDSCTHTNGWPSSPNGAGACRCPLRF